MDRTWGQTGYRRQGNWVDATASDLGSEARYQTLRWGGRCTYTLGQLVWGFVEHLGSEVWQALSCMGAEKSLGWSTSWSGWKC